MGLDEIPAICIDTRDANLALRAAERMVEAGVRRVILLTDAAGIAQVAPRNRLGVELVEIATLADMDAYCQFVLHEVGAFAPSDHYLIFQWDGFILHPHLWWPGFLDYDFVGAPWPEYFASRQSLVGNGGFSLRSRRLAEAVWRLPPLAPGYPEDRHIADHAPQLREQSGIDIAPPEVARCFSVEHHPPHPMERPERLFAPRGAFGFHGWFNMPLAYDDAGLLDFVDSEMNAAQKSRILLSGESTWIIEYLLAQGRVACALEIGKRIEAQLGVRLDHADPYFLKNVIDRIVEVCDLAAPAQGPVISDEG